MSHTYSLFTAIPYVNGAPHVGHALEFFEGDTLARYHRMRGNDVFFQIGADMYGQKNVETAAEQGKTVEEFTNANTQLFEETKDTLAISYDSFVRTHSKRHHHTAQEVWRRLESAGDIYKDSYTGLYCVGCESFILETDLVDGCCAIHRKAPVELTETNHFFRLSKYAEQIKAAITSGELEILPKSRANEILNVIDSGLRDVSFSRPTSSLAWGIPVPNDPDFVMYVWCDALTNYLTGPGLTDNPEHFARYWPANLHIIGKDILRFHAAIWPGMLLAAGLPLPKRILVHGFITSNGHKMSKSLGNVVAPQDILDRYGLDAFRAFFLGMTPLGDDIDFTWEKFHEFYDSELVNNIGNLTNRVLVMSEKYTEGTQRTIPEIPSAAAQDLLTQCAQSLEAYNMHMEACDLKRAFESIIGLANHANRYINDMEPWKLAKTDMNATEEVLAVLQYVLLHLGMWLTPFIPHAAERILGSFQMTTADIPASLQVKMLATGTPLTSFGHLFPRLPFTPAS